MSAFDDLMNEINELTIARQVALPHDEALLSFRLRSNVVGDFDEFRAITGTFCAHQFNHCIARGGSLSPVDAEGMAFEIIEQDYRRRGGTIVTAYNDAHTGTNGGFLGVLRIVNEGLKSQSVERHIRNAFNKYVTPNSWEQRVEIIRQFFRKCGALLSSSIDLDHPERYARDCEAIIREYSRGLQSISSSLRRL